MIKQWSEQLNRLYGKLQHYKQEKENTQAFILQLEEECTDVQQAQVVVKKAAAITQQNLIVHLSDLVTECLASTIGKDYVFQMELKERGGKSYIDTYVESEGEHYDPIDSMGGTVVDIMSFALRVASLLIKKGKSKRILILDEPFRNVSKDLQKYMARMVYRIAHELSVQFLIVTHEESLLEEKEENYSVYRVAGGMVEQVY